MKEVNETKFCTWRVYNSCAYKRDCTNDRCTIYNMRLKEECATYRDISGTHLISRNPRYGCEATCRTTATLAVSELIATLGLIPLCPSRPSRPEPGQISRSTISVIFCTLVSSDPRSISRGVNYTSVICASAQ